MGRRSSSAGVHADASRENLDMGFRQPQPALSAVSLTPWAFGPSPVDELGWRLHKEPRVRMGEPQSGGCKTVSVTSILRVWVTRPWATPMVQRQGVWQSTRVAHRPRSAIRIRVFS